MLTTYLIDVDSKEIPCLSILLVQILQGVHYLGLVREAPVSMQVDMNSNVSIDLQSNSF